MDNNGGITSPFTNKADVSLTAAVVMATYNGSQFIEEQLESIRRQSRPAERVIIRDDGSTDGTQSIVRAYILRHKLANWDFKENETNKGFTLNFLDAALEASEHVVFFSDQDDVWLEEKIEHAMDLFVEHEGCTAVLCGASIIDEHDTRADTLQTILRRKNSHTGRINLATQVSSMVASGHTLCVKRDFLEGVAPIIRSEGMTYDSPIGVLAAASGGLYRTGTVDVLHRVHSNNTSAPVFGIRQRLNNRLRHLAGRRFQLEVLEKCRNQVKMHCNDRILAQYDSEIDARRLSLYALENGQILPIISSILRASPMKNMSLELMNLAIALIGKD